MSATRTEVVTVRVDPVTLVAARKVAMVTGRTVSGLMEYALRRYVEKNFPYAFDPESKVVILIDDAGEL